MSEISPVYEGKLVHAGIFDFKSIYNFLYDLFTHYNYVVIEQKYSEKIKAEGKELEILWLCLKKISDYFRFRIKVRIFILGMISVEVVRENIKVKRDKGEIEIKIASSLERDYENKWESNPVTKFLRGIYDKYIIKSRIEAYEDAIATEVDEVLSQLKSYLALEGRR
ncbi:MAG: hypothetical protein N3G19_02175 [Candidatus Pacearchaeota archaeon]|nr:hypothetical protein [Candidatus Pacearchaeota archaeon]